MRPVWKWILGIIIVVILLCGVAAVGAFAFYRLGGIPWIMNPRAARPSFGGQVIPPYQMPLRPNGRLPMMPYGRMYGYRFGGLFPLGFFVRPLFCLGFLGLLALIALIALLSQRRPPTTCSGCGWNDCGCAQPRWHNHGWYNRCFRASPGSCRGRGSRGGNPQLSELRAPGRMKIGVTAPIVGAHSVRQLNSTGLVF